MVSDGIPNNRMFFGERKTDDEDGKNLGRIPCSDSEARRRFRQTSSIRRAERRGGGGSGG